jgi:lipid A 4'-phosphatase
LNSTALRKKNIVDPLPALWAGLVCLVVLTVAFNTFDWDQGVSGYYWNLGRSPWPGQENFYGELAYHWGQWPALLAGLLGGAAFLGSYRSKRLQRWRGRGLFLFLLLALGPGLLVNGFGKALMGRPRPIEVRDFGGFWEFVRPLHVGIPGRGGSFPSGHASMGFFWLCLYFLFAKRFRWVGLGLGLVAGALMSWARVAQGGHFLSDTLFSGAIVFTLAAALSPLIHWQPAPAFWAQRKVWGAIALGLAAYLSISQVAYEERSLLWAAPGGDLSTLATQRLNVWAGQAPLDRVALDLSLKRGDLSVLFTGQSGDRLLPLRLDEEFRGQGLPGSKDRLDSSDLGPDPLFVQDPGTLGVKILQRLSGAWLSAQGDYHLSLPQSVAVDARLSVAHGVLSIGAFPAGRQVLLTGDLRVEDLPEGFKPYGERSWLHEGEQPQIALTVSAPETHFQP